MIKFPENYKGDGCVVYMHYKGKEYTKGIKFTDDIDENIALIKGLAHSVIATYLTLKPYPKNRV